MNIVIVTQPDDFHAAAVSFGLKAHGVTARTFYPSDFPQRSSSSVQLSNSGAASGIVSGVIESVDMTKADVVWLRRLQKPVIPLDLHPADREFALRESVSFVDGLLHMLPNSAFWVNNLNSRLKANNKIAQLNAAVAAGVRIPDSLITNDPNDVRAFYERNGGSIIFKPFRFVTWANGSGSASLFTSIVTEDHMGQVDRLTNCPGIFQENVEKDSEIRVNVMGREAHAIRIYTQEDNRTLVDSRVTQGKIKSRTQVHTCDEKLKVMCFAIMDSLGINFGCFDFIINSSGEYVFLEVNEMGQFLWLEEWEPEIPVLDTFVKFLMSKNPLFDRSLTGAPSVTLADFLRSPDFSAYQERVRGFRENNAHTKIPNVGIYDESAIATQLIRPGDAPNFERH